MRNLVAGLMILGCVGSFVGCGVGDGSVDPEETQGPQITENTAALTTYNGHCAVIRWGNVYKTNTGCTDDLSCQSNLPNSACPKLALANNVSPTVPGCGGWVDMTRPCTFTR